MFILSDCQKLWISGSFNDDSDMTPSIMQVTDESCYVCDALCG